MIKHFLNRWYIRVQRKKPQTAKYSLYVWSLRWLWYIFAKIKTKITMPCEDFYTILIKQICKFQAEYLIKSIETSFFFSKKSNLHIVQTNPNFLYKLAILLEVHQVCRIFANSFCRNYSFWIWPLVYKSAESIRDSTAETIRGNTVPQKCFW